MRWSMGQGASLLLNRPSEWATEPCQTINCFPGARLEIRGIGKKRDLSALGDAQDGMTKNLKKRKGPKQKEKRKTLSTKEDKRAQAVLAQRRNFDPGYLHAACSLTLTLARSQATSAHLSRRVNPLLPFLQVGVRSDREAAQAVGGGEATAPFWVSLDLQETTDSEADHAVCFT